MPDFQISINQSVAFTGTSIGTTNVGKFVPVLEAGVPVAVSYLHLGGSLQVQLFNFNFDYPTGYSTMGIDLVLLIDGVETGVYQRFLSDTRFNKDLLKFVWSSEDIPAGKNLNLGIGVRSVLQNGPPCAIQFSGDATMRISAESKTLIFDPPGTSVVQVGSSVNILVATHSPVTTPVSIHLQSHSGLLRIEPDTQVLEAGQYRVMFWVFGKIGGIDYVTPIADGFDSQTCAVTVTPVLSSINPASGPLGTTVELVGDGFAEGAQVLFMPYGTKATTFNSMTSLSAKIPLEYNPNTALSVSVEVNGQFTQKLPFEITPPAPVITGLSPDAGNPKAPVTIVGAHFSNTSAVRFNGVDAVFTLTSDSAISTKVPDAATTGRITVVTPYGSAISTTDFTVIPIPPPSISRFEPSSAEVGGAVDIYGNNFETVTQVTFAGVPAKIEDFIPSMIRAIVPDQAHSGPITLESKAGNATSSTAFSVLPITPPTITSFYPTSGAPGSSVQIFGSHFKYVNEIRITDVQFNGVATKFGISSDSIINAVVPPGATSGPITITSVTSDAKSAAAFSVIGGTGFGTLQFSNNTQDNDTVTIWVIDQTTNDEQSFTLTPGTKSGVGTLHTNNAYVYYATSWNAVAEHNKNYFPYDQYDQTALITAQTVNFQRASSSVFPGLDGGPLLQVPIT